jgi:chaperonin GroES
MTDDQASKEKRRKQFIDKAKRIRLFSGRCMVLPEEGERVTRGGILLPDNATKEKPRVGLCICVAKEPHRFETGAMVPIEVKVGDRVLYGRFAGIEYKDDETEVEALVLAHNDVFGVLPE